MDEQKEIHFTLDGRDAVASPGETVLSVASRMGIGIPTLCHHPAIEPYGTCRLCVVEAVWGKRSKIVTSCIYTPWQDDVILTHSDRVHRTRKTVVELLLARCPGVEVLQELAQEYGVTPGRLPSSETGTWRDRCILCGLCVRVCAQGARRDAIGYAGRGGKREVTAPFAERAEACIGCRACVNVCPTNALHSHDTDGERVMAETNTRLPLLACESCGQSFTTVAQFKTVHKQGLIPKRTLGMCPDCRRTQTRSLAEKVLMATTL